LKHKSLSKKHTLKVSHNLVNFTPWHEILVRGS